MKFYKLTLSAVLGIFGLLTLISGEAITAPRRVVISNRTQIILGTYDGVTNTQTQQAITSQLAQHILIKASEPSASGRVAVVVETGWNTKLLMVLDASGNVLGQMFFPLGERPVELAFAGEDVIAATQEGGNIVNANIRRFPAANNYRGQTLIASRPTRLGFTFLSAALIGNRMVMCFMDHDPVTGALTHRIESADLSTGAITRLFELPPPANSFFFPSVAAAPEFNGFVINIDWYQSGSSRTQYGFFSDFSANILPLYTLPNTSEGRVGVSVNTTDGIMVYPASFSPSALIYELSFPDFLPQGFNVQSNYPSCPTNWTRCEYLYLGM